MTSEIGEGGHCEMWSAPLRPLIITSPFGPRPRIRRDGTPGPLHPGIDCRCDAGQPVYAVADGDVARSYCSWSDPPDAKPGMMRPLSWPVGSAWPRAMGFGECVWLVTASGQTVVYAHLSRRLVEAGEHVHAGQCIGLAGSTGYSSGVHLHLEVRQDRGYLDPSTFFAHLTPPAVHVA